MLIALPVVSTPSLIINSVILFFVKLVGLFNIPGSFKKSHNASFDILSKKIANCYFGILLFLSMKQHSMKMTLLYVY